jgi:polar amino acid transport system substrate-binding protein
MRLAEVCRYRYEPRHVVFLRAEETSMIRFRARHALLLAWILSLVLSSACASSPRKDQPGGLSRIVDSGELRIGMSGEQPPLSMTARNGELLGLDVALGRVLAQSMGVEAKFVRMPFGELIGALEDREVDLVMSGMTITPERARRVAFVGPYFTSGKTLLTRSQQLAGVQAATDLDSPELRLAALKGSTSQSFAESKLPNARLVTTEGLNEAIEKVVDGEVDALVADRETCAYGALRHPDADLMAGETSFTVEPMGIAVPLDEPRLANLVRIYLDALAERGTLEKAKAFWLKDPSWVKEMR